MIYLISPDKKQYKANLHCHSVLSDGHCTPEELKQMYKREGYSILAITDHERPHSHQSLSDDDFLMITGYECYIRPDQSGRYHPYAPEVHLNLFAREAENTAMVCMNECYCKYLRRDNAMGEIVRRVGSERPREFTASYINEYIRTAKENGYIVAYNHPYWSMHSEAELLAVDGCFSMEICNYSSYVMNGLEHNGALYDKLLYSGKRIFCHGADDNHNKFPTDHPDNDSFGAYAVIMPESLSYGAVIDAMEAGNMYASMGPEISEVSIEGRHITVRCSEAAHVYVYNGGKSPAYRHARPGESLTKAEFDVDENALYVRVSVVDRQGRWADTRGYTREEIGFAPISEGR